MNQGNPQIDRVFSLLDRDSNSFLTLTELNKFMVALGLEAGTTTDFVSFCEQTGASPDVGISMGDFTAAYAETPGDKLDEILRIHGKEWQAAQRLSTDGLPALNVADGDGVESTFDASALYGIDEGVLLVVIIIIGISATITWTRLRRCWRRCHSEEAKQKRDADRLSVIGDTARQISLDLDLKLSGMLSRSEGFGDQAWQPNSKAGLGDIKFSEMGDMVERLRLQGQGDGNGDDGSEDKGTGDSTGNGSAEGLVAV